MRVSSSQYHITVNASLQQSNSELEKLMGQMASGNRLTRPSDDPISHVRISRLDREEASIDQYLSNIGALRSRMSQSETLMSNITSDLLSTRDLLVWALDGGNTSEDLSDMATSLEALRDGMLASTLTKDQEGNYMFSGTATKTPTVGLVDQVDANGNPLLDSQGQPVQAYQALGNDKTQQVVVGNGLTQSANMSIGKEMADVLNALTEAIESIRQPQASSNQPATRDKLTAAMNSLDHTSAEIGSKISQLGGAQNICASLETNWQNLSTANQSAALDYAALDYTSAVTRLNSLMTAVQATQSAYAKVSQLSLFNVL